VCSSDLRVVERIAHQNASVAGQAHGAAIGIGWQEPEFTRAAQLFELGIGQRLGQTGETGKRNDSVLEKAELEDEQVSVEDKPEKGDTGDDGETLFNPKLSKKDQGELLRRKVYTVGKRGQPGEQVQNIISVGMLSEGWDAKTVTHIMGLRAFTSQLLCEQVVGRGLRRTSYEVNEATGLFQAEYVNVFGVPFTFLPHEGDSEKPPPPTKPMSHR